MPGRKIDSPDYRYGFQGQEHDLDLAGGTGVVFKYRVHDPRIGRFLSVDPLSPEYPWNSPYAFSENRVIDSYELEGLEKVSVHDNAQEGKEIYNGNYGDDDNKYASIIDQITENDNSCLNEICLTHIGPVEYDVNDPTFGVIRQIYAKFDYSYTGTDQNGDPIGGSGTIEAPVTQYRVSSGLVDAAVSLVVGKALGALTTYRLSNNVTKRASITVNVVDELRGKPSFSLKNPSAPSSLLVRDVKYKGKNYSIKSGHGYNRPHGPSKRWVGSETGKSMDEIESLIIKDLDSFVRGGGSVPTAGKGVRPLERTINVGGKNVGYRSVTKPTGEVEVGTYFMK